MRYASSAKTPQAMRDDIVTLLDKFASNERNASRIARRKRVIADHKARADAYENASAYIKDMEIKS